MINCMKCCAIREITQLSLFNDSKAPLLECLLRLERELREIYGIGLTKIPFAYLLFSGVFPHQYGPDFKSFILENNLGTVMETRPTRNPNSNNLVIIYIWTVDRDKLMAWWIANRPENNSNTDTIEGSVSNG